MKERAKLIDKFQAGKTPIFLISLKAGGVGLNLTAANYVVHLDPWWNPAIEQQATDRAYRIGQDQKVTVFHFIAKGTIEEKMLELQRRKQTVSDVLLSGTDTSSLMTKEDVMDILEGKI
jgi:SNF2 family DNA or RNA helicase